VLLYCGSPDWCGLCKLAGLSILLIRGHHGGGVLRVCILISAAGRNYREPLQIAAICQISEKRLPDSTHPLLYSPPQVFTSSTIVGSSATSLRRSGGLLRPAQKWKILGLGPNLRSLTHCCRPRYLSPSSIYKNANKSHTSPLLHDVLYR